MVRAFCCVILRQSVHASSRPSAAMHQVRLIQETKRAARRAPASLVGRDEASHHNRVTGAGHVGVEPDDLDIEQGTRRAALSSCRNKLPRQTTARHRDHRARKMRFRAPLGAQSKVWLDPTSVRLSTCPVIQRCRKRPKYSPNRPLLRVGFSQANQMMRYWHRSAHLRQSPR